MANRLFSFLFCALFLPLFVFSQDTTTADGLFQAARQAAFQQNDYARARQYLHRALAQAPAYADLRVFLGRLHAWSKQYDSARIQFETVLRDNPVYLDAILAYSDVEYWSENYDKALQVINQGLTGQPRSAELLLRKARVLNALRRYREANEAITLVLSIDNSLTEARSLAERIKENSAQNALGLSYDYIHFGQQFDQPWHFVSLDYTRQTKLGSVAARVNYANRFQSNGLQFEMDAYPRLSKTFYSYLNVGYSQHVGVFPKWRGGFSLFANLPASFEAEAGVRYLYFSNATWIYTGYVGKYYKSFLFGLRTYLTPGGSTISHSYNAMGRYYFGGTDDFVALNLGTGISPDETSRLNQLNAAYRLKTYKAGLTFKKMISSRNIITLNASYNRQEYQPGKMDNQVQAGVGYQLRF